MIYKTFLKPSAIGLAIGITACALFSSCQNKSNKTANSATQTEASVKNMGVKVAYVNLDTLEANYTYFKETKAAFDKRQASAEAQIKSDAQVFQNEYIKFQKQAQSGAMTQAQGQAAQEKLGQMQQDLEQKRQNLTAQLVSDQQKFTQNMQNQLDSFLNQYNKDKHFDYILSYTKGGGNILLVNPKYNITNEIVKAMNNAYKTQKAKK